MESKATFVAIENDGQKRTIENWKKADILLLLEALRVKNQDLYAFMQDCVAKGYRQMNLVGIQCEEPPPLGHYCTSEKKTPTFKSSLNDGQLEILASNPQLSPSTSFLRVHVHLLLNLQIIRTEIPTSANNIPLPHNAT